MPSSRARSSADMALIDPAPTPKPRAVRKTVVSPVGVSAADAPAAVPAKKAVRKTAARKAVAAEGSTDTVSSKPVVKKVVAKKSPAKKLPVKTGRKPTVAVVLPVEPLPALAAAVPARSARKRPSKKVEVPQPAEAALSLAVAAEVDAVVVPVEVGAEPLSEGVEAGVMTPDTPVLESIPEPEPEPELLPWSTIQLQADAWGQHLRWQAGQGCPPALQQQVQAMSDSDGALNPLNDQGLLALHQSALDVGHDLRISTPVWSAVAAGRDLRWRVHRLEQAYPEGAASPALQAVWPATAGRLTSFQWEGALFAACAGRCLLADDVGLSHAPQALAAAALLVRHFGVRRVLILCPDARLLRWQGLLAAMASLPHRLCGESAWATEAAELTSWAPELVIVDDTVAWRAGQPPAGVRTLDAGYVTVLMPEPAQRAHDLADWLAWLDPQRLGVARQFARRHRDEAGGWIDLERLRDTLAPVMLRRTRSGWMQPVPGRRDRLVWVPLDAQARAVQQAALLPLQAVVARWRAVSYVSDQDQLTLREALARLRGVCAAEVPAKREALLSLGTPNEGVCAELPWPLSALREPRPGQPLPSTYLLTEGGMDEQRLWLRCIDPQADDWLCDAALFRQGASLARRMEALGWLVDRWVQRDQIIALQDAHQNSAL